MTLIAVAGLSARMMAEAAARDGFEVIALDLFGDADTRLAASQWMRLGEPGSLHIDEARTLSVLRELMRRGDVSGWIAGSGFEGHPELLDKAASVLQLFGTPPEAVARVRDPAVFFGFLSAQGIAHPPVRFALDANGLPGDGDRWLIKDARGCGGWHIRRASARRLAAIAMQAKAPHAYLQQEVPGIPMSATFIADGHEAIVLGFNELTVRRFGAHPFVYCGAIGPVPMPPKAASRIDAAVQALTAEFALRGLCSLDFMRDGDQVSVLEVNPRPPASMALYEDLRFGRDGTGLMSAHLRACVQGELPAAPDDDDAGGVRGTEIVFAQRAGRIDDAAAQCLVAWPGCHDLPCAGAHFGVCDPVCSLSASGNTAAEVREQLNEGREALWHALDRPTKETST
jgi:predicted ATP-grasp superfamily ATP-dependent carboligase